MQPLKILHLEDSAMDAELIAETLRQGEVECEFTRVDTEEAFTRALDSDTIDLILSDFSLPGFDGKAALALALARRPQTPFIFVSGTIGEDAAIESLTGGATDYVLKHKFSRLLPAVERAHREAQERRRRERSEEALRRSEEKYRSLFEESKDAIFILRPDGRFQDINGAGVSLLGYASRDEILESGTIPNLYADPASARERDRQIEQLDYVRDLEMQLRRKDQEIITVLETATAVRDDRGVPIEYRGVWRDVTGQRAIEAQLLRAQRLESIGMLATGIAHDLNNILTPILMGTQLMKARFGETAESKTLGTIEQSALRGADLVRQILTFARGERDRPGDVPLSHLVQDIERIVTETFPRSIRMITEVPQDLWAVRGVGTQIHQMIMNLAVNARDAMSSGGVLTIACRNVHLVSEVRSHGLSCGPGRAVVVEVRDTGEGISTSVQEKIFEAFFTTKAVGYGTGLGLSTVQTIAENHGGVVVLNSELQVGTTFTIYLPAAGPAEEAEAPEETAIPEGSDELILVVDDEAAIRDMTRAMLEGHGYRVLTAEDGVEGLKIFGRYQSEIQVVISELDLPNMGGQDMADAIHRSNPGVPIMFATGSASRDAAPPIDRAEMILKPFTTETLLGAIHQVTRQK